MRGGFKSWNILNPTLVYRLHNLDGGNSNIVYFHPEPWGNNPILTSIFFKGVGWNHQLDKHWRRLRSHHLKKGIPEYPAKKANKKQAFQIFWTRRMCIFLRFLCCASKGSMLQPHLEDLGTSGKNHCEGSQVHFPFEGGWVKPPFPLASHVVLVNGCLLGGWLPHDGRIRG